jgi:hypothetical protein
MRPERQPCCRCRRRIAAVSRRVIPSTMLRGPIGDDLSSHQPKGCQQGIVKIRGAPQIGRADGDVAKQAVVPMDIL